MKDQTQNWVDLTFSLFDTQNLIRVPARHREVLSECLALCEQWHHRFSPTDPDSDVSRLSRGTGEITIHRDTVALLSHALTLFRQTEGYFDPTLAPSIRLWQVNRGRSELPDDAEIAHAGNCRGAERIRVTETSAHLPREVGIDLGGIAKGYIADELTRHLRRRGVDRAMINLGGNVMVLGEKSEGEPWRIGVRSPWGDRQKSFAVVACQDCSVVTSAANERYFEYQGRCYHHLLDPNTGCPAESDLLSATVVSPSSTRADALSTACFVAGMDRARSLLARAGEEGILVDCSGRVVITGGLGDRVRLICDGNTTEMEGLRGR